MDCLICLICLIGLLICLIGLLIVPAVLCFQTFHSLIRFLAGSVQLHSLLLEETFAYAVETQAMRDTPFWRAVVDAILYALAKMKLWVNPKKVGAKEILIFAKAAARKHAMVAESGDARYAANFLNTFLYSGRFEHSSAASDHESNIANALAEGSGPFMDTGFRDKWLERDVPAAAKWWENFIHWYVF